MLVSARPPAACLPLPRCSFASLPLWFIASFTYWTFVLFILWTEAANQWNSGPLLHVEQCSFCEQEQWPIAPRGTMFILWTETANQWGNGALLHGPYRRACAWGYETLRPTPHHTTPLNHCAIPTLCRGHTGTTAHHSAYLPRYQAIAPLCLCFRPIVLRLRSAASDRFEHPEAEGAQNVQNWNSARKHWFSAAYNSILKLAIWQSSIYIFVESGLKLNSSISTY